LTLEQGFLLALSIGARHICLAREIGIEKILLCNEYTAW